ncbi:uncharacterized protein [Mytilus edulis]|uniref:uncharacterized protein n=1 Tax=Mytilus edulis TaxID=6550 RepID=UPI0039EF0252
MTPDELQHSTILWIRCCQAIAYQDEVRALKLKQIQKTKLPRLRQLRLYLDNNDLMRCKGKIHNTPIPESAKHPYLLPPYHRLSELIVLNSHELVLHSGINATVTQVCQTICIPSLRQFTRKLLHRCSTCKRVIGKPYRAPDHPPLHKIRLQEAPSFTVTGVDFSLHIKEKNGTLIKSYICLFTCPSTRVVHLEVVPDMTEESFLLGFRRFTCKKSLPNVMMSDNATSFISASQEIKQLCESQKIKKTLSTHGVEWRFIHSRAPWFGDIDDSELLTPAHLLYGRRITSVPYPRIEIDNIDEPYVLNTSVASKRAQRLSFIIAQFWNRWKSEYLTALREFQKKSGDNKINIRVGDIVQVHDDKPRNRWKIAIVEELVVGNDGLIRSETIRTNSGRTTHPIVKLYPLEINEEELPNTADETNEVGTRTTLHMRKAAMRAKENIKSWTNS